MDARRILQIPLNMLELCVKVTRRHYSFTDSSFSFSLFLLLHFDDFNVFFANRLIIAWFLLHICDVHAFSLGTGVKI